MGKTRLLSTQLVDDRPSLSHRCLSKPHLGLRQSKLPTPLSAASASRLQSCSGALANEFALEFGKCREYPEDELPGCGGRIDLSVLTRKNLESDASVGKILYRVGQMPKIAAETIEFPDHRHIALAERFQAGFKAGAIVALAGDPVFVDPLCRNTRTNEGIVLQVGHLTAIGFGNSGVSYEHGVYLKRSVV